MSVSIRPAVQSDVPYLYDICLKTGNNGKDASHLFSDPWLIGQFYAAPYLFYDKSFCFIAEEEGIPLGYILSTETTIAFYEWLEKSWLPVLRNRYPLENIYEKSFSINEKNLISRIHSKISDVDEEDLRLIAEYPAHLHIDLLPELQGKGCGRMLMETLFKHLKSCGCPGLHLGVSRENPGAVGFYSKIGFSILKESESSFVMGVKF